MPRRELDKSINDLEEDIRKMVDVIKDMKEKEKQWQQERAEMEERLRASAKRVEELSGERGN